MKKIAAMLAVILTIFSSVSLAASPPKRFFGEKINTFDGNRMSWGEVGELTQCLKENGNSISWEAAGNSWIMHTKNTDKLTKKINKTDWLFDSSKLDGDIMRVYLTRVIINKDEIKPTTVLSSLMACWKKEAEEAKREAKRQAALEEEARIRMKKEEESRRLADIEAEKEKDRLEFEAKKSQLELDEKIRAAEQSMLKERAQQEEQLAAIEKNKAISRLAGHYEMKQSSRSAIKHKNNDLPQTVDVQVISDGKIKFSLHNKAQRGSLMTSCDVDDQEANIQYTGKVNHIEATFGDIEGTRRNQDGCFISLKFKESSAALAERMGYTFSVEVDQRGCKSFCSRAGSMSGRYIKVSD